MLAGAHYRGDFEERMKNLIKEVESKPKTILFIDEIHQILGAGTTEGSASDAATMMKTSSRKRNSSCCWGHDLRRTQKNLQQRLGSDETFPED